MIKKKYHYPLTVSDSNEDKNKCNYELYILYVLLLFLQQLQFNQSRTVKHTAHICAAVRFYFESPTRSRAFLSADLTLRRSIRNIHYNLTVSSMKQQSREVQRQLYHTGDF